MMMTLILRLAKEKKWIPTFFLFAWMLIGCSSSPAKRISEHEREFVTYPPEVQAQIQAGHVEVGFTEDMVYMAKGNADETLSDVRYQKQVKILKYYDRDYDSNSASSANAGFNGIYGYPTPGSPPTGAAMNVQRKLKTRLELIEGKVTKVTDY